jgi:hypothetical protein
MLSYSTTSLLHSVWVVYACALNEFNDLSICHLIASPSTHAAESLQFRTARRNRWIYRVDPRQSYLARACAAGRLTLVACMHDIKTGIFGRPTIKVHLGQAWRLEFPYRNIRD